MIRVISIGNDRNVFDPQSGVAHRMVEYGTMFGELHVVVFTLKKLGLEPISLAPNVFLYPTNSSSRFNYILDAVKIGKAIGKEIYFGETVLSTQDPYDTGPVGVILKRSLRIPLQIQIHTDLCSPYFYNFSMANWIRYQISRWTLRKADGIRVVRSKIADNIVDIFKIKREKIVVLPIFVDIQKIKNTAISTSLKEKYPEWTHIVLMASRLTSEKQIDIGIEAIALVAEKFPNVGLVVVGSGPLENKLKALSTLHAQAWQAGKSLKLKANVAFEPWQSDLSSYYKSADVFLNTSRFEGFGMTLVESAALLCPVVTTHVGIAEDLLRDGRSALICPVGDVTCIANKLINLLGNPTLATSLVSEASSAIEPLNLTKEEYVKRYAEALLATLK